jgi:hypothetical protein
MAAVEHRLQGSTRLRVVGQRTLEGIAPAEELLDVAAGGKRLLAVAAQDDTAHLSSADSSLNTSAPASATSQSRWR